MSFCSLLIYSFEVFVCPLCVGFALFFKFRKGGFGMRRQLFVDYFILMILFVLVCALGCSCKRESNEVVQLEVTKGSILHEDTSKDVKIASTRVSSGLVSSQRFQPHNGVDLEKWNVLLSSLKETLDEINGPVSE